MKVQNVLELLDGIAPFELAEEWDNVGLLVGYREAEVERVLCALDLTEKVLDKAIEKNAQMIVTHHPVMFRSRKRLTDDDAEGRLLCRLIREEVALAAVHTNYDNVHPGVNDALAATLGLQNVAPAEHGMCVGELDRMSFAQMKSLVEERLGSSVRAYGDPDRIVRRVAVLGGAGEDFVPDALATGVEVYVTGEMSYHKGLSAVDDGLCVLEAGHAATENPAIKALGDALQIAANDVQYKIDVLCSAQGLFL